MIIITDPPIEQWKKVTSRHVMDKIKLREQVSNILDDVRKNGDAAVNKYNLMFDGFENERLCATAAELDECEMEVAGSLKNAIKVAKENITKFHRSQLTYHNPVEISEGIRCWQKSVPIQKVGLYIPGGTAPLFSTVLMLGIPAEIAGCREVILCTPAGKDGKLDPAVGYTARLCGIRNVYKIGGAQAIAAMAYGTVTVPQVYKIFGPGNQYVNCAKQLAQLDGVAIDMPAGPSEVCILADETAVPEFVAADLLSQAEHGVDSQVMLVSHSIKLVDKVRASLERQLKNIDRQSIAQEVMRRSKAVVFASMERSISFINEYACEHLVICCDDLTGISKQIVNAGSVFLGNYSAEAAGDYASGTNHTLPTNGFAKSMSGVGVESFMKKISFQQLTREGLISIADEIKEMAMAEGLTAHANAVSVRIQ